MRRVGRSPSDTRRELVIFGLAEDASHCRNTHAPTARRDGNTSKCRSVVRKPNSRPSIFVLNEDDTLEENHVAANAFSALVACEAEGNSASTDTPRARAMSINSKSATQRL